jgi:hypothetical protein
MVPLDEATGVTWPQVGFSEFGWLFDTEKSQVAFALLDRLVVGSTLRNVSASPGKPREANKLEVLKCRMTMTPLSPKAFHPATPSYLAIHTNAIPVETVAAWKTISTTDHLPDCTGQVTSEENVGARIRRWTCSKCSVRGAKAL